MNHEFFELLYADPEFCEAMGRATLAAGRLESTLRAFLQLNGVTVPEDRASFGLLINFLERHGFLSENGVTVLRTLKKQRNYLTHSLFDLFSGRIPETMLPRSDLVPLDIVGFTEKARALEADMLGLSKIAERRLADSDRRNSSDGAELLFCP